MLWIRIDFNEYPDPGSLTNPDPDPGQILPIQKVEFLHDIIFKVDRRYAGYP